MITMNKFSRSYLFRFTISTVQLDSPVPQPGPSYDSPSQRFPLLEILEILLLESLEIPRLRFPLLEINRFRDSSF